MFYTSIDFIKFMSQHVNGPVLVQSIPEHVGSQALVQAVKCKILTNEQIGRFACAELFNAQKPVIDISELIESAQLVPVITLASYIDKSTKELVIGIASCTVRDYLDHKLDRLLGRRVAIMDAVNVDKFRFMFAGEAWRFYRFSEGFYAFDKDDSAIIERFIERSIRYFKVDPKTYKPLNVKIEPNQSTDQVQIKPSKKDTTAATSSDGVVDQITKLFADFSDTTSAEAIRTFCSKIAAALAAYAATMQTPPKAEKPDTSIPKAKVAKPKDPIERVEETIAKIKAGKEARERAIERCSKSTDDKIIDIIKDQAEPKFKHIEIHRASSFDEILELWKKLRK